MIRIYLTIFICVSFCVLTVYGQDPIYTQFYNAPNQINPAFVGNTRAPLVALNYRLQWPGLESAYSTYMVSYDQFHQRYNSGVGLSILADDAGGGTLKTIKIAGLYSYRVYVQKETYLKLGMELGVVQSRLDVSKLVFLDQLDPQYGVVSPGGTTYPTAENLVDVGTRYYPDIGAGIMIYNTHYYAGIGLKHLNNPDNGFLDNIESIDRGIPTRFTLHGGVEIPLEQRSRFRSGVVLVPSILYVRQGEFSQINIGANLDFGFFFFGMAYRQAGRNADAVIASMGVRSGIWKIGYSYDLTVSGLGFDTGGSHELGIILNFDSLLPKESRYNDCLNLFR